MLYILHKLLGLSDLAKSVTLLKAELDSVKSELETLETQVSELEIPDEVDTDDFVLESDFEDKVREVIRDEVSDSDDIVDEVYEKIEEQLEEMVDDAVEKAIKNVDKASFGDEEELKKLIREVILNSVHSRLEVR